jgi:hypothetical protein
LQQNGLRFGIANMRGNWNSLMGGDTEFCGTPCSRGWSNSLHSKIATAAPSSVRVPIATMAEPVVRHRPLQAPLLRRRNDKPLTIHYLRRSEVNESSGELPSRRWGSTTEE